MSECWGKIERKRGANREVEDCGRSENMRGVTQFDCGGSHRPREECVCAIHWQEATDVSAGGKAFSKLCSPPGTLLTNRPRGDGGGGGEAMKVEEKTEERAKVQERQETEWKGGGERRV